MTPRQLRSLFAQTTATLAVAAALGQAPGAHAAQGVPFSISVDGAKVDGSAQLTKGEAAASKGVDIQVKFDGLDVRPLLKVSTLPLQVNFRTDEHVRFLARYNYGIWIKRAEVRIVDANASKAAVPFAVLPVNQGVAEWTMPKDAPERLTYVLRVYDAQGRFDETQGLPLTHLVQTLPLAEATQDNRSDRAAGSGNDRMAVQNISAFGGAITVYGKNIPAGYEVRVMGEAVPVDQDNSFTLQRILPPGKYKIDISVLKNGKGLNFVRDVEISENEWFGVGIADITAGYNLGQGIIEHTSVDEYPGIWTRGRVAMYLKGKIKGRYVLTASADSGEGRLEDMISGLAGKDPRSMLKRISPDDYYPVYGDDSTSLEDAPTSGKFYVKLERGPSFVEWGNFQTHIEGSQFMASQRSLYGASVVYRSEAVTKDGAAQHSVDAYAALPVTVPQTDTYRGTGGSAYFMAHQDITVGSDVVSVEVRNPITGWVISRRQLVSGTDYNLNTTNGVLILNAPLLANNEAGQENYLVVHYNYEPIATDNKAYSFGGRVETWIGDNFRLGATGMSEQQQSAGQTIYGADIRAQTSPQTYVEAEVARSRGPGFSSSYSVDGGLTQQNTVGAVPDLRLTTIPANANAFGWRVGFASALEELSNGKLKGHMDGSYEHDDAGFSSPSTQAITETVKWGVNADVALNEKTRAKGTYSENNAFGQSLTRSGEARFVAPVTENVDLEPYAKYTEQNGVSVAGTQNGARGDGGLQLTYHWDKDNTAYVFGQGTFARSGTLSRDDRGGVGARVKLTDKTTTYGEISQGTLGINGKAGLEYAPNKDDRYNIGYVRDSGRSSTPSTPYQLQGTDLGNIVLGARHKFNDQWTMYNEDTVDLFGARRSMLGTYGLQYKPVQNWTIDGSVIAGRVSDNSIDPNTGKKNPDIYRDAASLSATYHDKAGLDGRVKGEVRWDKTDDGSSEIMSYLMQLSMSNKLSKDWRSLFNLDAVLSQANVDTKDGTYISSVIGAAYRPELSDWMNALVKYQYLYDAPGADQVTADGTTSSPSQISHIVSADVNYALNEKLTLGGKYAFRIGLIKERVAGADWTQSQAHLGIIRLDYNIVKEWDLMTEARALWSPGSGTADYGFVAAIYRAFGEHFKFGVGYNFGDFSDDISHISHDNHGVFVNLIGKF